ncbi:MAG: CHAT domain-containing protein [Crocosphaera sp.]
MNEQRNQAYLTLINQLLSCKEGDETKILQENQELLDQGLIEVMIAVAQQLEEAERENEAQFLMNIAQHLAQVLGLLENEKTATETPPQDYVNFLMETLQKVAKNPKPQEIYPFWQQNLDKLDDNLIQILDSWVKDRLSSVKAEEAEYIARVIGQFCDLIAQFPLGNIAINKEIAITGYEIALTVFTFESFPVNWATAQNNLANAYRERIRGETAENIEQAITGYTEALKVYTFEAFPVAWAATQNNLALAYSERIRGETAENIEQAITSYTEALKVYTFEAFPVAWAATQNNLAVAYLYRIRGERAENIEQAIAGYTKALKVRTFEAFPVDWAVTQNNLANAYRERIRGERAENIEQAITCYTKALKVRTFEAFPVDWAVTQNDLAVAYYERIRGDKAENIERAIADYTKALKVYTFEAFPVNWAGTQNNLANAYSERIRGDKAENIERAIAGYTEALKVRTFEAFPVDWAMTQNNLAVAYYKRIRGEKAENLEKAITSYQNALKVFRPQTFPENCRRTAWLLGNLYTKENRWQEAIEPYQTALEAVEVLYEDAVTLLGKDDILSATDDLFHRTAYALARVGDLESAVVTLERGHARNLRETLARDRADLETVKQLNPELYDSYYEIANELRNLEQQERMRMTFEGKNNLGATPESNLQLIQQTRQRLKATLEQIRQLPDYENFLALPTFTEISQAIIPNHPLIYLTTTEYGSLALIVHKSSDHQINIESIFLDNLRRDELGQLLGDNEGWFGAYYNFLENQKDNQQKWFDTIDRVTHELWSKLMQPVILHLHQHNLPKAILIPTGLLSLLPLHAAWTEDKQAKSGRKYALDDILFTYIPNALSLTSANAIASHTPPDTILGINEPLPVSANKLPNSTLEVQTAIESFPNHRIFQHQEATRQAVKDALNNYNVVHFSCHGTANLNEPLQSGLVMANVQMMEKDPILSLQDLFELNLNLRLAILSACETSLPGIDTIDEVVSLPTGLLQTGVAGVVASLWSVSEISTMILMARFYDLWRRDNLEPSEALLKAQKWVRDTTKQEKADYFNTLADSSHSQTAKKIYQQILLQVPNSCTFAHPFHWAAFGYHGV